MLYRKIPKNGDELSVLGFGCMRLMVKKEKIGEEWAKGRIFRFIIDEERAAKQLHYRRQNGFLNCLK